MDDDKETMVAKAIGLGVALAAAWVAQQLVGGLWRVSVGHKPPKAEDAGDHRLSEVILAASLTGAVVALSRVLATRGAAKFIK